MACEDPSKEARRVPELVEFRFGEFQSCNRTSGGTEVEQYLGDYEASTLHEERQYYGECPRWMMPRSKPIKNRDSSSSAE